MSSCGIRNVPVHSACLNERHVRCTSMQCHIPLLTLSFSFALGAVLSTRWHSVWLVWRSATRAALSRWEWISNCSHACGSECNGIISLVSPSAAGLLAILDMAPACAAVRAAPFSLELHCDACLMLHSCALPLAASQCGSWRCNAMPWTCRKPWSHGCS
jgi:hypothetical protein